MLERGKFSRAAGLVIVMLLTAALLAGCAASSYSVTVGSQAIESAPGYGKRYILAPFTGKADPDSGNYKEYEGLVERLLAEKGYTTAASHEEADQLIIFGYDQLEYQEDVGARPSYTHALILVSLEVVRGDMEVRNKLWNVTAVNVGPEGDLHRIFPALVTAAKDYVGIETDGSVVVKVSAEDTARILE